MSAETSMTDEIKTVAEKILSWAQILITELHSIKSHTKDDDEEVEKERKKDLRKKMRRSITHFTDE